MGKLLLSDLFLDKMRVSSNAENEVEESYIFFFFKSIYFEREIECVQVGEGQRQKERERILSRLCECRALRGA